MPEPDQHAAEQAASVRDDWQYSRIFSSPEAKPGFTALLALRAELQQLQASTGEPGIASVKFEWWRGELARAFANEAQHPVAQAVGLHLKQAGSAAEYCQELVDAAETEHSPEMWLSEQDFRLYLYRSGGVLAEQLALLHGLTERRTLDAARRLGQLKRLTELVLALHPMLRANRWLFPRHLIEDQQLDLTHLATDAAGKRRLLAALVDLMDSERVETRTRLEDVRLPPALALQWSLAQRDYKRLRAQPAEDLFDAEPPDGPLRRLWAAWRGARAASRNTLQHQQ